MYIETQLWNLCLIKGPTLSLLKIILGKYLHMRANYNLVNQAIVWNDIICFVRFANLKLF